MFALCFGQVCSFSDHNAIIIIVYDAHHDHDFVLGTVC